VDPPQRLATNDGVPRHHKDRSGVGACRKDPSCVVSVGRQLSLAGWLTDWLTARHRRQRDGFEFDGGSCTGAGAHAVLVIQTLPTAPCWVSRKSTKRRLRWSAGRPPIWVS
jgi:hypothetical protein